MSAEAKVTVSTLRAKKAAGDLIPSVRELARERAVPPAYFYKPIEAEDSDAELVTKVFLGNRQSLEDTLKLLDPAALAQAVTSAQ